MKRLLAIIVVVLAACSTTPNLNRSLESGYQTVEAYVTIVHRALVSGRINVEQAERASTNAKAAKATLDQAAVALAQCNTPVAQCASYLGLMQAVQPALLTFEQELRQGETP